MIIIKRNGAVWLCPVCATPCTDRHETNCSGCGSNRDPVFVHQLLLIRAVELLIKRGIGVIDSDVRCYTSHKLKITINLAGNVPEYLFADLPNSWQIKTSKSHHYQLCCSEINPDSNNHIIYNSMIKKLEDYLMAKDVDGFKSVLMLSGYDPGQ
jgi:hypothetical protein